MNKDHKYLLISFLTLVALDLLGMVLFFYKAHPNFTEWYKHLK